MMMNKEQIKQLFEDEMEMYLVKILEEGKRISEVNLIHQDDHVRYELILQREAIQKLYDKIFNPK